MKSSIGLFIVCGNAQSNGIASSYRNLAPGMEAPSGRQKETAIQTWAVFSLFALQILVGPLSWAVAAYFILTTTWGKYLVLSYLAWMYIDRKAPQTGGKRWNWLCGLKWWEHYRDYFPVKLVKTADLPPDRNYLFAAYPHGLFSTGVFVSFVTNALKSKELLGLKCFVCTLNIVFRMPVIREIGLAGGLSTATESSINWILGSPGKGRAAVLVPGGASEAMYCKPGVYEIIITKRKGFCKLALQNGSPLVPVFSFGETDLYDQIEIKKGSWLEKLLILTKKILSIPPVIFYGRKIVFLPRRAPITVVVGRPIEVQRVEHPSKEEIDELHRKFKESLVSLFNKEKHKYLRDPTTELTLS